MWDEEDDVLLTPAVVRKFNENWMIIAHRVFLGKYSGHIVKERYDYLAKNRTNATKQQNQILLQQNQRLLLRLDSLVARVVDGTKPPSTYLAIASALSSLIDVSDLASTARSLDHCCTLLNEGKSQMNEDDSQKLKYAIWESVLPEVLTLLKNPLLEEPALSGLLHFFEALVDYDREDFNNLWDMLFFSTAGVIPSPLSVPDKAMHNIASCVAALYSRGGDEQCSSAVNMLLTCLQGELGVQTKEEVDKQHLALLCLGKIGRTTSLIAANIKTTVTTFFQSDYRRVCEDLIAANIKRTVTKFFHSDFRRVCEASSYALGNLAVGSLPKFLPFILKKIEHQDKQSDYFLQSLKELLFSHDVACFNNSTVAQILASLLWCCERKDEWIRSFIAECLAKLALIEPETVVPELVSRLTVRNPETQLTVIMAFKFATVQEDQKIDEMIKPVIPGFLRLLKDSDQIVKDHVVLTLMTLSQRKSNLLKGCINEEVLHDVYEQTSREKYGLDISIAAWKCVITLFMNSGDEVNPDTFIIPILKKGLEDADSDVRDRMIAIIPKLAHQFPNAILSVVDFLVETFESVICFKEKDFATDEQHKIDRKRTGVILSAIASLESIDGVYYSKRFKNLKNKMSKFAELSERYRSVRYK